MCGTAAAAAVLGFGLHRKKFHALFVDFIVFVAAATAPFRAKRAEIKVHRDVKKEKKKIFFPISSCICLPLPCPLLGVCEYKDHSLSVSL